jgi:2-polyprenyl-3-methyl-5-hydroxy-6-metoxy-1,4-benzoquinol methylase
LAFVHEHEVDPEAENDAHSYALDMVGFNKAVLEIGCGSGLVTKALADRACRVVAVEVDAEAAAAAEAWAEEVIVGHVERDDVWDHLSAEKFDVVLLGDVLEHLEDPLKALRSAVSFISRAGMVVLSVPNVAHGDVRMALFRGEFPYQDAGLLDRTHLHFFTRDSIGELCRQAGLVIVDMERVVTPLFQTELGVVRDEFDQHTIHQILQDPEAETYQFVVKAVLDNGDHVLTTLADRVMELNDRAHHEVVRTALLREELRERDGLAQQVRDLKVRLKERDELALQVQRLQSKSTERDRLARQVEEVRAELRVCRQEIDALLATKTLRYLGPFRRLYGRLLRLARRGRGPGGQG